MLEECNTARIRWGGVSDVIDRWLSARQELIVLYCSINGVNQFHDDKRPVTNKLREMCQILVDYVSAGHFEIYEKLVKGESRSEVERLAQTIIQKLESNTESCLEFNDGCESVSDVLMLQNYLSQLGETLEERFSLEDRMIEQLHSSSEIANSLQ